MTFFVIHESPKQEPEAVADEVEAVEAPAKAEPEAPAKQAVKVKK